MNSRYFPLLLGAGLLLTAAAAVADPLEGRLKRIAETGQFVVGHREASAPFSYVSDIDPAPVGFGFDISQRIFQAIRLELAGHDVRMRYRPVTPASAHAMVRTNSIDIECGAAANLTPVLVRNDWRAVQALESGRADAWVGLGAAQRAQLSVAAGSTAWVVSDTDLRPHIIDGPLPANDPTFKRLVDRVITRLSRDGELAQLERKWFAVTAAHVAAVGIDQMSR